MRFTTSVLATLIAVVAAAPAPEAASVDSNVQLATSLVQEKLKAQGCRDEKTFLECLLNGCPPIIPPGGCISEITCYIIWCT
ncbi:hypothetical protein MCOR31_011767 [Pyricularia oryzae]|nr:hypothetical protein MCOR34_003758 [Pyricularia oryzae]KAI6353259.1 hypothetical protein MCOR31_011767 [Pyricularia oryzae]KAI6425428.1 hypothetical protein MCOR24_003030 [Pyricularia oryzae]KAI6504569.1 hypothetical protein MCOR13_004813 [Pyricularia oryzae]KAI6632992.1 hypothetical protein MCOR14_006961 [Pyricularia oryzae]